MIDQQVYAAVRNGVCAIGYLSAPLTTYRQNPESGIFQVIGTGFLVRDTTILTNRHVIGGLLGQQVTAAIPRSQLFVQFVAPTPDGSLRIVPRMIREVSYLPEPGADIGFVRYSVVHEAHFESIQPVTVVQDWNLVVSEEVAVCGYPYGTQMFVSGVCFRWGPVVQQGHISAVSPFDTSGVPAEILLDVRTADGMSGAPVFRPATGEVIGVHYAGIEATTAFALALNREVITSALDRFNDNRIVLNG